MDPVRIGIVSPGRWGRKLLDAAGESSKLAFAGVTSRNRHNAEDVARTYGGACFESYEDLLDSASIEAVLIATPHHLHYPQTMRALRAGKHVFVEKPIANTVGEAKEMAALAEARKLTLSVGLQMRRNPAARKAKQMIENGELGAIAMAVAVHGAPIITDSTEGWKADKDSVPGGPLDQLGVHYADLMAYLLGPISRVTGFYTDSVTGTSAPDAATVAMQFAGGVPGVYMTHQVSVYVSELRIFGTRGALVLARACQELYYEPMADTRTAQKTGGTRRPVPFEEPHPHADALTEELEDFANCVRTGAQPEVGAPEAIAALRVMRAAMEAQKSGATVDLL